MKDFCPICLTTTEQIDLWDGKLYCVVCLMKKYPDIYHQRKTNDTLCSKPNWQLQGRQFLFQDCWRSAREEMFSEYFSNLKNGLFLAFVIATLFTLPFMTHEFQEDLGINSVFWQFVVAAVFWLAAFVVGFSWFVVFNLLIGKKHSTKISDSPLISIKHGIVTITCRKRGFFVAFRKASFQVPARFKMFTDGDSNITNFDTESIYLDVTDVYEQLKKIPGQCFACDNNTNRFYINCNVDNSLQVVWIQFISLCYCDTLAVSLSEKKEPGAHTGAD
jgi:hypothetical protein